MDISVNEVMQTLDNIAAKLEHFKELEQEFEVLHFSMFLGFSNIEMQANIAKGDLQPSEIKEIYCKEIAEPPNIKVKAPR